MRQKTRRVRRLRQLRRAIEMSQAELAARVGLSKATICLLETGGRDTSTETAKLIADVFKVTVDEAFRYVEVPR